MSCCAGLFCCFGWDTSPHHQFQAVKWMWLSGWVATVVLTWVLRDYASQGFADHIGQVEAFCSNAATADDQVSCAGGQIAMRISFANFVFFMLHALLTFNMTKANDPRVWIHTSGWGLRLAMWVGTLIGFFWVPTKAIYGYAQFARIASGFYLILQLILLINFIYEINEWLTEKDNKPAWALLVVGAVLSFGLGMVGLGFAYHWYTASPSCHLNIFFCTWSLIMGLAIFAVLFIPNRAQSSGLLTSGLVYLYCTFLLLSSLSSEPEDSMTECRRGSGANDRWITILGFFIALACVIYSTYTAGIGSRDMFGTKDNDGLEDMLPYRADFFHLTFALASLYIAMLFSNWEVSSSFQQFELDKGWISTWVKIASKWCCELLYGWSVIAPALFPNRDFGP